MTPSFYTGCPVDRAFMDIWRSKRQIGSERPSQVVLIRRGRMKHTWHDDWPDPQFGQIFGEEIRHQWYPTWTPLSDWTPLPGVAAVDLSQDFSSNGITSATITCDNVDWVQAHGPSGTPYHTRERGFLWPYRGYVPNGRPGSGEPKNEWYMRLPNAQILVIQGYGEHAFKTFTGLVDDMLPTLRPDRMQITARDFGGMLVDIHPFGWNKQPHLKDPIQFTPPDWPNLSKIAQAKTIGHHIVLVNDVCDIVRCALRWSGFQEWQIEDSGVNLSAPKTVDKTMSWMDVINDVAQSLGYQFFMAEPDQENDLSIGIPVFRKPSFLISQRSQPIVLRSDGMLTDCQPHHANADERYIIRTRGQVNNKTGRTAGGDSTKRVQFAYWPPWTPHMAGIIKQLTFYDIGSKTVLGLQTVQQAAVAAVLIAVQIALARDTATVQCPGQPGFGIDSFAYLIDPGTGVNGRLYITNRKSTMTLGGDGTGQQKSPYSSGASSQNELIWATELGGALIDTPEFDKVVEHYNRAVTGDTTFSWDYGWA